MLASSINHERRTLEMQRRFRELEGSLANSQGPVSGSYADEDEYSSHSHDTFKYYPPVYAYSSKWSLPFRLPD
jgi:hypothetical protein